MVAALLDYEADLCGGCGHLLSESLYDTAKEPDHDYQASFYICRGCQAKERAQRAQAAKDKPVEKAGGVIYHAARLWSVITKPRVKT